MNIRQQIKRLELVYAAVESETKPYESREDMDDSEESHYEDLSAVLESIGDAIDMLTELSE